MKRTEPIKTSCKNQRGLALLLASFSILFVSLLVIAFLEAGTTDLQILDNFLRSTEALYVADAGVEHAISGLRQAKDYHPTPSLEGSVSTGGYSVTVSGGPSPKTITSTGEVGKFKRKIVAVVTVTGSSSPYTVTVTSWKEDVS